MASASINNMALICLFLFQIWPSAFALIPPRMRSVRLDSSFQWSSITPSEDLVYHDCYHDALKFQEAGKVRLKDLHTELNSPVPLKTDRHFKCARLLVPLDWQNTSNPNKVAIAIIKLPAKIPRMGASHGGAILVNPGGPGGSGVQSVRMAGHMLRSLVDGEKNFDIISFDPRGVAFSTPSSHCFGDYLSDEVWELKKRMFGLLDTGPEAMKMQFAAERGRAALCAEAGSYDDGDGNIRAYMTTAYVARDMLEIVKKNKVVEDADSRHGHGTTHADEQQTALQGNRKAQLQYIGFSYGTFLGNTFASMYPEHVGKMLLDGNVDAVDCGRKWFMTALSDFEEGWSTFFERCFSVGKTCPLFRPSDTGPADIRSRVDSVLEQIKQDPIPLTSHGSSELITYSDIKLSIISANYNPVRAFPPLATVLNAIYTHNSTHPSLPARLVNPNPSISCFKNASSWPSQAQQSFSRDATFSTLCTDASSLASTPLSEFQSYFRNVSSQSPIAGPVLAELKLACMAWPRSLESKWRFSGPFGTNDSANDDSSARSPIFFLNNRLDPVCPIRNAHNMARKYKGSVVLEQDAVGHCALTAGLGPCVMGYVNRYFNQGVLPEAGTVCPGGCRPFDNGCAAVAEEGGIRLWGDEGIW